MINFGWFCNNLCWKNSLLCTCSNEYHKLLWLCVNSLFVKGLNPGVISKVGWTYSWIGLLLLTVTDVWTTCAVVIFRVKVSCITSVDGIILWLLIWLANYVAMLLVVCKRERMTIWLTIDDCLTVTIDGLKCTNYWLRVFIANNIMA